VYVYLIEKIYAIPPSTHVGQVDAAQGAEEMGRLDPGTGEKV